MYLKDKMVPRKVTVAYRLIVWMTVIDRYSLIGPTKDTGNSDGNSTACQPSEGLHPQCPAAHAMKSPDYLRSPSVSSEAPFLFSFC